MIKKVVVHHKNGMSAFIDSLFCHIAYPSFFSLISTVRTKCRGAVWAAYPSSPASS